MGLRLVYWFMSVQRVHKFGQSILSIVWYKQTVCMILYVY